MMQRLPLVALLLLSLFALACCISAVEGPRRPAMMRQEGAVVARHPKAGQAEGAVGSLAAGTGQTDELGEATEEDNLEEGEEAAAAEEGAAETQEDEADVDPEEEAAEPPEADASALESGAQTQRPKQPATPDEIRACTLAVADANSIGDNNPYWKGTTVQFTDFKVLEDDYTSWSKCLSMSLHTCLVAGGVMWNSQTRKCVCLYGDVNPQYTDDLHVQWVCKFKKDFNAKPCYLPNWLIGQALEVNRTFLSITNTAEECALQAEKAGCDAAEMPRGSIGNCTCVNKLDKAKDLKMNTTAHSRGTCILSKK